MTSPCRACHMRVVATVLAAALLSGCRLFDRDDFIYDPSACVSPQGLSNDRCARIVAVVDVEGDEPTGLPAWRLLVTAVAARVTRGLEVYTPPMTLARVGRNAVALRLYEFFPDSVADTVSVWIVARLRDESNVRPGDPAPIIDADSVLRVVRLLPTRQASTDSVLLQVQLPRR